MLSDKGKRKRDVERAIQELGIAEGTEERGMMRLAYELEDQQASEREATLEMMDWIRIAGAGALLLGAIIILLVLTFVLAPEARGDDGVVPDAPRAKALMVRPTTSPAPVRRGGGLRGLSPVEWSPGVRWLAGVQGAAELSDGISTRHFTTCAYRSRFTFEQGGKVVTVRGQCVGLEEADPISRVVLGAHPGWSRMIPIGAAEVAGSAWLAQRMRRSERWRRWWWAPQVALIGVHTVQGARNWRYGNPVK